jgi:cytochrome P450
MRATQVDLLDPAGYAGGQPHDQFRWLRANDPVHRHDEPGGHYAGDEPGPGFWAVTSHELVREVGRDPATYSSRGGIFIQGPSLPPPPEDPQAAAAGMRAMMLFLDPPVHSTYRRLTNRGFTPRGVTRLEDRLRDLSRRIIDAVIERGECDLVADIAGELPSYVVAELLGLPLDDGRRLYELTEKIHALPDAFETDQRGPASQEMAAYAYRLAQEKRANPADDMSSALLQSEIEGRKLSDFEFVQYFILLVDAGGDTTRNLVGAGMHALFEHLGEHRRLMSDLDRYLPTAIEEMLRFTSPVVYMRRTATRDAELGGKPIAAGDKVVMFYGSANRDESVFDDPDRFDVGRTPNEHVAFGGGGPHFCLGAHLARLEIEILLREMLTRMPDVRPAGEPEWLRSTFISGPRHLPVAFVPGPRKA